MCTLGACSAFRLAPLATHMSHAPEQYMRTTAIFAMSDDLDPSSPAYRAKKEAEKNAAAEARRQRAVEVRPSDRPAMM